MTKDKYNAILDYLVQQIKDVASTNVEIDYSCIRYKKINHSRLDRLRKELNHFLSNEKINEEELVND